MGNSVTTYPHKKLRIVIVGSKSGDDCLTELRHLPEEAIILGQGLNVDELRRDFEDFTEANVLLNVTGNSEILSRIILEMPHLVWIHSITAGVDHIICPEMTYNTNMILTKAKGVYSSSLAEYVIGACMHFAKSFSRLEKNRIDRNYDRFDMKELKNATIGIIGYGDIGAAIAKVAKAFDMKVIALRRRPELNENDENVDYTYGSEGLLDIVSLSDYIVVACALTPETEGLISKQCLESAKQDSVLINISRGLCIDENALIEMLQSKQGPVIGAALDVFCKEPLPEDSPLWNLDNILLSPHNADKTVNFRHNSIKFFCENCKLFMENKTLDCQIDLARGY